MESENRRRGLNIMPRIRALEVGQSVTFPIEWMASVRTQASNCNALFGGRRTTSVDTRARTICVTRRS